MYLTTDDFLAQILLPKTHCMVFRSAHVHYYVSYELRYVQPNFDVSGTLKSVGIPELFTRALSMTVSIFKCITQMIGTASAPHSTGACSRRCTMCSFPYDHVSIFAQGLAMNSL